MNLKNIPVLILLLAGLLLPLRTSAVQAKENDRAATVDRIITMRNWKLMEQFNLSGRKARQVFSILDKIDTKRADLIKKRRQLLQRLKEETRKTSADDNALTELIKEYLDIMAELATIPAQEIKGLQAVFTVKEQARYLLFSQDIAREIRQLMRRQQPGRDQSGDHDGSRGRSDFK